MAYTIEWLPGAERDPIPGVTASPFETEADPTWKLLLHTTEGGSYSSALGSYRANGFAPNVTAGPDPTRPNTVKAWQHLPLDSRSTTLADREGGIRPNRDYVIQVEIVGYCDKAYAERHGPMWLYVHNWPDWYKAGIARVLNQILNARPIPRRSTVTWRDYPQSAWADSPIRLSGAEFDAYAGILGHQHAPENTHGDPGNLADFVRTYLINQQTAPQEEDDMQLTDKVDLDGWSEKTIGLDEMRVGGLLSYAAAGGWNTRRIITRLDRIIAMLAAQQAVLEAVAANPTADLQALRGVAEAGALAALEQWDGNVNIDIAVSGQTQEG